MYLRSSRTVIFTGSTLCLLSCAVRKSGDEQSVALSTATTNLQNGVFAITCAGQNPNDTSKPMSVSFSIDVVSKKATYGELTTGDTTAPTELIASFADATKPLPNGITPKVTQQVQVVHESIPNTKRTGIQFNLRQLIDMRSTFIERNINLTLKPDGSVNEYAPTLISSKSGAEQGKLIQSFPANAKCKVTEPFNFLRVTCQKKNNSKVEKSNFEISGSGEGSFGFAIEPKEPTLRPYSAPGDTTSTTTTVLMDFNQFSSQGEVTWGSIRIKPTNGGTGGASGKYSFTRKPNAKKFNFSPASLGLFVERTSPLIMGFDPTETQAQIAAMTASLDCDILSR